MKSVPIAMAEKKIEKRVLKFISASDWLEQENNSEKISTGSNSLNNLLGGGIESGAITEVFGEHSSGKSQLAYQLAYNNFIQNDQKDKPSTLVFDTELRFRIQRIVDIAKANKMPEKEIEKLLQSIKKIRIENSDDLLLAVNSIKSLADSGDKVKLVIIDSLMVHFRAEYSNRSQLSERQHKIAVILHTLNTYAKKYGFAVYFTNHVMTRPDDVSADPLVHLGGNVVGHFSEYRIYLKKGRNGVRIAKLVDSPRGEGEVCFKIENRGICDV